LLSVITVGSAVQIKRSRLSSVYLNYLSRIPGHAASWCQNYQQLCTIFSMVFPAHSGPWPLIQFRNHFSQTEGRVISPSQVLYLNTWQHKHRINAYTHQTSMPWVGFEPTIPSSERAQTVHALDRAVTVTCAHYKSYKPSGVQQKVAYLLKARTMETEKQPLLVNIREKQ
jgi:hypothetical protein